MLGSRPNLCPLLPRAERGTRVRAAVLSANVSSLLVGACSILRPHPGSWKECGNHLAVSAMGSDVGTGLAIRPCFVIVCHLFGKQALPLSPHFSFEQEAGLGGPES